MEEELIEVDFQGATRGDGVAVDYMCAFVDGLKLLAEVEIEEDDILDSENEKPEAEERHYEELKADIIRQAEENGINPKRLKFFWG